MLRGILSKKWDEIQLKYDKKMHKKYGRPPRGTKWSGHVSKLLLHYSITNWKHRCEVIHALKEGTDEASTRARLLEKALELQSQPWRLIPSDRHLCNRSIKYFKSARMTNLLMWEKRVTAAESISEKKALEVGDDLSKYFTYQNSGKDAHSVDEVESSDNESLEVQSESRGMDIINELEIMLKYIIKRKYLTC